MVLRSKGQKVLLLYAKAPQEVHNRHAALGSAISSLAGLLQKNGYAVYVNGIFFENPPEIPSETLATGIKSRRMSLVSRLVPKNIVAFIKDFLLFRAYRILYRSIVDVNNFDLIIEFYSYGSNLGYKLAQRLKAKLLVIYDAPIVEEYEAFYGQKPTFQWMITRRQRETLKKCEKIMVYSDPLKKYLIETFDLKDEKIVKYQNLDFSRISFTEAKPSTAVINIGFIGSFLPWHRVDLLVVAFEQLKKMKLPVKLSLVGKGMEFGKLEALVEASKYAQDISMFGYVDGDELAKIKEQIHVGVMPGSNWYGMPAKLLDYGAARMAVVAPNTPAIADNFQDAIEILLFEQDSIDDLVNVLKKVVENEELRNSLGIALQRKIQEKFSEESAMEFYGSLIQSMQVECNVSH